MSIHKLKTYCLEKCLSYTSNKDVSSFLEAFPEHEDTVNALRSRLFEVNLDDILVKDVSKLGQYLKQPGKLIKVTLKQCTSEYPYRRIAVHIAHNCKELEALDIPAFELCTVHVHLLCSLTKLKYLNIWYMDNSSKRVSKLIKSNPHLESISLRGEVSDQILKSIPKTIKEIKLSLDFSQHMNSFLEVAQTWKLEKLDLAAELRSNHILILGKLTTLKHLNIRFQEVDSSLETLFRNNQLLEEVHLHSNYNEEKCDFLKHLPRTLKCIKFHGDWNLVSDAFVNYIRNWKLETLQLHHIGHCQNNFIINIVMASLSLRELDIDIKVRDKQNFTNFERLCQLKVLRLGYRFTDKNHSLVTFLRNCVNLEKLEVDRKNADREILSVIGSLSYLREFSLNEEFANNITCIRRYIEDLSRSKSLRTVRFHFCFDLSDESVLTLIRNCKSLTKLDIFRCHFIRPEKQFLSNIVRELEQQTDRTKILTVQIKDYKNPYLWRPIKTSLHRLLNLNIIHCCRKCGNGRKTPYFYFLKNRHECSC